MARLVLATQGTGGDMYPFLRVAMRLRERGHDVTFLTHSHYAPLVRDANVEFVPLDTREALDARISHLSLLETPHGLLEFYQRHILPSLLPEVRTLESVCRDRNVVVVAHHDCQITAQFACERLGLGMVRFFIAPHCARNLSFIAGVYGVISDQLNAAREALGLASVSDWLSWLQAPRRSFGIWTDWFGDDDSEGGTNARRVGFMLSDDLREQALSEEARMLLDVPEPLVLITHGTSRPVRGHFFEHSVRACEELGLRGVVVTRDEDLVPRPLPARVAWIPSLPFGSAMKRAAVLVHHGGIGTLAQGLAAAVPQLVLGLGFDRPDNGLRLERLGVGLYLPPARWHTAAVAAALRHLIGNESARSRCRELAARMGRDAATVASETIEEFLCDPDSLALRVAAEAPAPRPERRAASATGSRPELNDRQRALIAGRLRKAARSIAAGGSPATEKPA